MILYGWLWAYEPMCLCALRMCVYVCAHTRMCRCVRVWLGKYHPMDSDATRHTQAGVEKKCLILTHVLVLSLST